MLVLKKENHITGDDIFGVNGLVWGHDGLIMDFFGELMEQGEDKVKKKIYQRKSKEVKTSAILDLLFSN